MDDSDKQISVLCLGPKGSGKTTLLKKLQDAEGIDNTYSPVPTVGTNIYDIYYLNKHGKKQMVSVREIGGEMASLWRNYLDGVETVRSAHREDYAVLTCGTLLTTHNIAESEKPLVGTRSYNVPLLVDRAIPRFV